MNHQTIMFLILTALVYFQVTYAEEVVNIPDPNLEAIIRAEIGKPEDSITDTDLQSISSLDSTHDYRTLEEEKIVHLTGLEYCTNLQYLFLGQNKISDISALSGLKNLQQLYLGNNQISDISTLSSLANLQELYLSNNQISNISALSGLANLQELYLSNNQISDISALSELKILQRLQLDVNQVSDISALSELKNLQWLSLFNNRIIDISALSGLTNLQNLFLVSNQIIDISALSGLTNLQNLGLENNRISDIQPLLDNPGIDSVGHLSLDNNPLNSISQKNLIPTLEQQYGVKVSYQAREIWDVNGDGTVDISDLALVGSNFGKTDEGITGDVNDDGIVDIFDLVLVGGHFGEFTRELKAEPATNKFALFQMLFKRYSETRWFLHNKSRNVPPKFMVDSQHLSNGL